MGWGRRATATLLSIGASLLVTADLRASTSVATTFDALVGESTAAAFVTPMSQTALWEGDRIVTYTDLHVDQPVAGASLGEAIWVRTLGGEVGNLGQSVAGEAVFTVGRPSLVFVRPAHALASGAAGATTATIAGAYVISERAQGQFPEVLDGDRELHIHQSSAVGATIAPRGGAVTLARDVLHGMKVRDVTTAVAAAWKRVHGG